MTQYFGVPRFRNTMAEETNEIGIATGLAWTEVGGEILVTEATLMPGKGHLTLTGKLGDVMQESAQAAMSYVRSKAEEFGIPKDFNKRTDVHIHVPEGAIPKDGPSAGITLATALVSALTRIPIRKDVAMTGEITLRGKVLPIGGVKEKVLAAHRAGVKNIVLPKDNEKDLADIPKNVLDTLNVYMVQTMDEVLKIALAESLAGHVAAAQAEPVDGNIIDDTITPLKIAAEFVTSAAGAGDFPDDGTPEIALVGRSNVGKSSLINALVRQRLARTSAAPGKTRLANIYSVARGGASPFYLVDLPGYGYARGGPESAGEFEALARAYFGQDRQDGRERREGKRLPAHPANICALLLVDARHPGLISDRSAWQWILGAVTGAAVVATKIDKLARGERIRALRELESVFENSVLPVSAVTGEGLDELWKLIDRLLTNRNPQPASRPPKGTAPPSRQRPRKVRALDAQGHERRGADEDRERARRARRDRHAQAGAHLRDPEGAR